MDSNDIEISRLRDREYARSLSNEAIIDLAERWVATAHYHCQNMCFPSGVEGFDWVDFPEVSHFLSVLAESRGIDSGPIADLSERTAHGMDIDKPVAQQAIVIVQRLIAQLRSNLPSDQPPEIPDLGGPSSIPDERPDTQPAEPVTEINRDERSWLVCGRKKVVETHTQHKVVESLVKAGPYGLSLDELRVVSPGCRDVLNALRRDPDWEAVIRLAGKSGGRYRITKPG